MPMALLDGLTILAESVLRVCYRSNGPSGSP
jgi:hypothetical protein